MDPNTALVLLAIALVVIFDLSNGFHDSSNMIASVIASRAMTPIQSVALVGTFTFLGPVIGGTAVANTIGKFVSIEHLPITISMPIMLCGLFAAVFWNLLTWKRGLPSSSSHALVGGLMGVVMISAGPEHIVWGVSELLNGRLHGVMKVILALFLSPLIGFWLGFIIHRITLFLLRSATPSVNKELRGAQWFSTAALAFSYGANDAQKSMGILTLCLVLSGTISEFIVPTWVMLLCACALTFGTVVGGWRIVKTLAFAIFKIRPLHALNSQISSALLVFGASLGGAPVSTTHVVSSSIMGIGASERPKAVRWAKAKEIGMTWLVTIPGSALVSIFTYWSLQLLLNIFSLIRGH